jgi:hypothetical protein
VNKRVFWLAPLILFLGGCAVSAKSADVPEIEDLAAPSPEQVSYTGHDPLKLVGAALNGEFARTALARGANSVTESNGTVTIWMAAPASTLSSAEAYLRFCKAAAAVMETDDMPSSVKAIVVVQPDGREIAGASREAPTCAYR